MVAFSTGALIDVAVGGKITLKSKFPTFGNCNNGEFWGRIENITEELTSCT